jgi:hypothetical protein
MKKNRFLWVKLTVNSSGVSFLSSSRIKTLACGGFYIKIVGFIIKIYNNGEKKNKTKKKQTPFEKPSNKSI